MSNLLTYYDINWKKYLHLFNEFSDVQVIFIIPTSKNCLKLRDNVYEISGSKINTLNRIGPFITLKTKVHQFDDNNIEEAILRFYFKNRFCRWIGVQEDNFEFKENLFKPLNLKYNIINSIAILIPHRDREKQLELTVNKISKYIRDKNLDADLWVCQQDKFGSWNKGCLLNISFSCINNYYDFFIINDCDTYLENNIDFNLPTKNEILHLYGYGYCLGGIFCFHKSVFKKINGYNNNFFNWGREDREIEDRCKTHNIKINRSNLIKINKLGVVQLDHKNENNYWTLNDKTAEFYKARQLYYFNQVEHFKSDFNGLSNLYYSKDIHNYKIIVEINLIKWTDGNIKLNTDDYYLDIISKPNYDTGIIEIFYDKNKIVLPINKFEKYPKIFIIIQNDKLIIKINYLIEEIIKFKSKILINKIPSIVYKNIELDFDIITTKFNKKDLINYYYDITNSTNFNILNTHF